MNEVVHIETHDGIATVTLNRPERHNGLNFPMFDGLVAAARQLDRDDDVRVVILRGAGPSFCSGLDVKETSKQLMKSFKSFIAPPGKKWNVFQECALAWRDLQVPVVAAVHGSCFGGGMQIALGADFRYCTPDAKLSIMEIKWGLIPDMSGTVTLRELLPNDVAMELAMSGRVISGAEAKSLGLVTRLCADPYAEAMATAAELAQKSPDALAGIKAVFHRNRTSTEKEALRNERRIQARIIGQGNQRIAVKAGLAKETPKYGKRQRRF